ncbi:uncharacterized protein LOC111712401 [Eurytemora carolleeae]|uniref:uncharacterized protein LOC111712401 n=1 Tax=Eurytemora carolleeae TaxID=1294199 RepID=UPI000C77ABCE|nr:uncharacterized protein LOC111712401 [Eurytemora carolleeae]|eukprot:XP_023342763.1 uncharacterized protein LOC111712401 [Eurytemora affinis]
MKKEEDEEVQAMRECIENAFWYRSLPGGLFTGSLAMLALQTRKIKTKTRFGGLPIVLGFGSMGYILGKFSFILSNQCMDIFLKKAPESPISLNVRQQRETELVVDEERFMDILEQINVDQMSEKEHQILEDCNDVAFYSYSLPLSSLSGGGVYYSLKQGLLKESRIFTSFPRVPKTVCGTLLGYILGQYLYVKRGDCPRRFLTYDEDGQIAQLLRRGVEEKRRLEEERGENKRILEKGEEEIYKRDSNFVQHNPQTSIQNKQDYILPGEDSSLAIESIIRDSWTNSLDPLFKPV